MRLFVERAIQVQPAFRLTAQNAASVVEVVRIWTAFLWRLNWRQRGCVRCPWRRYRPVCTTALVC